MIYAIGDVHGRLDSLQALHAKILEDIEKVDDPFGNTIVFLGDYVDRGPDSKGVLDFIINLNDSDKIKYIKLLGNHEQLFYDTWAGTSNGETWVCNGGIQTAQSFGFFSPHEVIGDNTLQVYMDFIKNLPTYYEVANYIFCHSGYIRWDFPIPLEAQTNLLIWGRPHKGQYIGFNKYVIHGHTPHNKPLVDVNRINVDIGCGHPGYTTLACVVLPMFDMQDGKERFIFSS